MGRHPTESNFAKRENQVRHESETWVVFDRIKRDFVPCSERNLAVFQQRNRLRNGRRSNHGIGDEFRAINKRDRPRLTIVTERSNL